MSDDRPSLNRFSYITRLRSTKRPGNDGVRPTEESRRSIVKKQLEAMIQWIRSRSGVTFPDIAEHFAIPPTRYAETQRQLRAASKMGLISIERISKEMRDHIVAINLYLSHRDQPLSATQRQRRSSSTAGYYP